MIRKCLWIFVFAALLPILVFAQKAGPVKPGTRDFKAIVLAAKAEFQKSAAFPIKTPSGVVRRAGVWAYVHDGLSFVDPKHEGDGEGLALLKLTKGKWKVIDSTVGSGGMEEIGADWEKQFKLPKGLVEK